MLRWGILSTAKIGVKDVIPAILRSDNSVVTAIASRNLSRAEDVAAQFGVPHAFGSYDELLASDEIDAVYIPLITSDHAHWSIEAANAGKHVLCEKPISLNAEEIHAIILAAGRNKVTVAEAVMITYHPQWLKVRSLIAEGAIGTLTHVQGSFTYFNDDADNMRNDPEKGGGALLDIGIYPVAATRFATGLEPKQVMSDIRFDPKFGTDTHSINRIAFEGFELSMYVSTQMALRQSMVFHGDKGWIEMSAPFNAGKYGDDSVTLHDQGRGEITTFRFPDVNQYTHQVEAFARHIKGEAQPEGIEVLSLESSLGNQRVIDALFEAGKSGGWVDVPKGKKT
jgi:predicted dehydrogenase